MGIPLVRKTGGMANVAASCVFVWAGLLGSCAWTLFSPDLRNNISGNNITFAIYPDSMLVSIHGTKLRRGFVSVSGSVAGDLMGAGLGVIVFLRRRIQR
jgi:hypothetical protein